MLMDFSVGSSQKAVDVNRGMSTGIVNMTIFILIYRYTVQITYF